MENYEETLKNLKEVDFTEVDLLLMIARGWSLSTNSDIQLLSYPSTHSNFDNYSIKKLENDWIVYSGWYPVNVDCDDGRYDIEHFKKIYLTLDVYLAYGKPLYEYSYIK